MIARNNAYLRIVLALIALAGPRFALGENGAIAFTMNTAANLGAQETTCGGQFNLHLLLPSKVDAKCFLTLDWTLDEFVEVYGYSADQSLGPEPFPDNEWYILYTSNPTLYHSVRIGNQLVTVAYTRSSVRTAPSLMFFVQPPGSWETDLAVLIANHFQFQGLPSVFQSLPQHLQAFHIQEEGGWTRETDSPCTTFSLYCGMRINGVSARTAISLLGIPEDGWNDVVVGGFRTKTYYAAPIAIGIYESDRGVGIVATLVTQATKGIPFVEPP